MVYGSVRAVDGVALVEALACSAPEDASQREAVNVNESLKRAVDAAKWCLLVWWRVVLPFINRHKKGLFLFFVVFLNWIGAKSRKKPKGAKPKKTDSDAPGAPPLPGLRYWYVWTLATLLAIKKECRRSCCCGKRPKGRRSKDASPSSDAPKDPSAPAAPAAQKTGQAAAQPVEGQLSSLLLLQHR